MKENETEEIERDSMDTFLFLFKGKDRNQEKEWGRGTHGVGRSGEESRKIKETRSKSTF